MRTKNNMSYCAEDMTSVKDESYLEKVKNCRILMNVINALKWHNVL